jgi:hypothetical protein
MCSCNLSLLKPIHRTIEVLVLSFCLVMGAATVSPSFAQAKNDNRSKQLANEKNRLNKLTDPAERAECLMKIANITLTLTNDAIAANDIASLASSLDEFRRVLTVARDTMIGSGLDAYKKPKGYQAIELATRSHLRILEDFSRRLSPSERQPVDGTIELVSKIHDEIVDVLFFQQEVE